MGLELTVELGLSQEPAVSTEDGQGESPSLIEVGYGFGSNEPAAGGLLNLTDALAGDPQILADLLQGQAAMSEEGVAFGEDEPFSILLEECEDRLDHFFGTVAANLFANSL